MTDEEILKIAERYFRIGLRPRPQLTDMHDGTLRFVQPEGLTRHGEHVLLFARALIEQVRLEDLRNG